MYGITDLTYQKLINILSEFPQIDKAIIYGSRALGKSREGSDIDLTILGKKLNQNLLNKLSLTIDDANTPYLYDISIYSELTSENLKEHIDKHGKVFYQK